jgi:hypothetical protein
MWLTIGMPKKDEVEVREKVIESREEVSRREAVRT